MIGIFGWLDVTPPALLLILPVMSALVAIAAWGGEDSGVPRMSRTAAACQLVLAAACIPLVMTSLYLVWTPAGSERIEGVQGRYFLPMTAAAAIAIGRLCPLPTAAVSFLQRPWAILVSLLVPGVSLAAHVGGLVAGAVAALVLVVLPRRLPSRVGRGGRAAASWGGFLVVLAVVIAAAWYAGESMDLGFVLTR